MNTFTNTKSTNTITTTTRKTTKNNNNRLAIAYNNLALSKLQNGGDVLGAYELLSQVPFLLAESHNNGKAHSTEYDAKLATLYKFSWVKLENSTFWKYHPHQQSNRHRQDRHPNCPYPLNSYEGCIPYLCLKFLKISISSNHPTTLDSSSSTSTSTTTTTSTPTTTTTTSPSSTTSSMECGTCHDENESSSNALLSSTTSTTSTTSTSTTPSIHELIDQQCPCAFGWVIWYNLAILSTMIGILLGGASQSSMSSGRLLLNQGKQLLDSVRSRVEAEPITKHWATLQLSILMNQACTNLELMGTNPNTTTTLLPTTSSSVLYHHHTTHTSHDHYYNQPPRLSHPHPHPDNNNPNDDWRMQLQTHLQLTRQRLEEFSTLLDFEEWMEFYLSLKTLLPETAQAA